MEKKTLFEIPIYSMSKKEFNRRWDKQNPLTLVQSVYSQEKPGVLTAVIQCVLPKITINIICNALTAM